MKSFNSLLATLVVLFFTACDTENFEIYSIDPNRPVEVPASLIFNGVLNSMYESPWSLEHRWNQYYLCNYNYYGNNEYNWTSNSFDYYTLKNVVKMVEENGKTGADALNEYSALGKFFKAFFSYRMTMKFGDIPYSEALQGAEITIPRYDAQKQVFVQVLNLLDEANTDLASLIAKGKIYVEGDIYLNGDLTKWQRVVNAFKIRVMLQLSKKASDPELKIQSRFSEILSNPAKFPLLRDNDDNLAYKYVGGINNYPKNPGNQGFDVRRYNMSSTFLNQLVALKDPRTFVTADPAEAKIAAGLSPTDFNAYLGADPGESLDDMTFKMNKGEYSAINQKRYYSSFGGPEPGVQIGYVEMAFNIAEGIHRGWATGDANSWYLKGIEASMQFFGINDQYVISNYLSQESVGYKGGSEGLTQILTQKYLGLFNQAGWESYYTWRRTGVPQFSTGVGTGNSGNIPLRWQYPLSERTANKANYESALSGQYGGKDDINSKMWLIQ